MAYTPLDFWSGWMRNSAAMMQTGFRLAETARASSAVISSRSKTILAAGAGSSAADQAELARMVPEKIEAFSRAGMATFSDIVAFQTDAMSAWQQLAGMAMSGRLPTATQLGLSPSAAREWRIALLRPAEKRLHPFIARRPAMPGDCPPRSLADRREC